jgi:hypothetical protein
MLKELVVSIISGIISALILQAFTGRSGDAPAPRQTMSYQATPARRGGGFARFLLAVGGGIGLAYVIAPFLLRRRYRDFGGYDDFDGLEGLASHAPMLILTVITTIIVWAVLSALTRR